LLELWAILSIPKGAMEKKRLTLNIIDKQVPNYIVGWLKCHVGLDFKKFTRGLYFLDISPTGFGELISPIHCGD
jgi:hypothetical protein